LFDPDMATAVAETSAIYIAGHLRGHTLAEVFAAERPVTWRDVAAELGERLAALPPAARARTWIDPGLGFGKGADPEANLALIRHARELGRSCGAPVVVGPSRKRFLRCMLPAHAGQAELDSATVAACLTAVAAGAHVLRIHNVALLRAALAVYTRM
jgi:dihydropteroate synthase